MSEVILEVLEDGEIERNNFIPLLAVNRRVDGAYVLSVTGWVRATGALADARYFVGPNGPATRASDAVAFRVEEIVAAGIVDKHHLSQTVLDLLDKVPVDGISREDEIAIQQEGGGEISIALDVSAVQIRRKLEDAIVTSVTESGGSIHVTSKDKDGNSTTTTLPLAGSGQATELTTEQVRDIAGNMVGLLPGLTYDPATNTFSGRLQTGQNYPFSGSDFAAGGIAETKLSAAVRAKLNSSATSDSTSKLLPLSAVPATAGYSAGEIIDVLGVPWVLVSATGDANVITGTAGHDGQNYVGIDTIPDGATYGTVNGGLTLSFEWAPSAEGVHLVLAQLPFASAAAAPATIYARADTGGEYTDVVLRRTSDRDETLDNGVNVYGYGSGTTGTRISAGTGVPVRVQFFRNPDFATGPISFHSAARFEPLLTHLLGTTNTLDQAEVDARIMALRPNAFSNAEKAKLAALIQGQTATQVAAQITAGTRAYARAGVSNGVAKAGILQILDTSPFNGSLLGDFRDIFSEGVLAAYLSALSAANQPALRTALRPYLPALAAPTSVASQPVTSANHDRTVTLTTAANLGETGRMAVLTYTGADYSWSQTYENQDGVWMTFALPLRGGTAGDAFTIQVRSRMAENDIMLERTGSSALPHGTYKVALL